MTEPGAVQDAAVLGAGRPLPRTIVLVGAPGAGKSTVGKRLAKALGCDFTDVDQLIEQREQTTISEIFLTRGEAAFRALEHQVTLEQVALPGVVSLGGGAVMDDEIRAALVADEQAHVVWLEVSAAQASRRVGMHGTDRPLLAGGVHATMVRLMNQRLPLYAEVASSRIDTNGMRPPAVARAILSNLGHEAEGVAQDLPEQELLTGDDPDDKEQ